jgi:hypothetical protein
MKVMDVEQGFDITLWVVIVDTDTIYTMSRLCLMDVMIFDEGHECFAKLRTSGEFKSLS